MSNLLASMNYPTYVHKIVCKKFEKFIMEHPDIMLRNAMIGSNHLVSLECIESNLDAFGIDWGYISQNPNITIEFVKKYCDTKMFSWENLSQNPGITMHDIEENLHLDWNWKSVTYNPNNTVEFMLKYPDKPWDWNTMKTKQSCPSMNYIEKNHKNILTILMSNGKTNKQIIHDISLNINTDIICKYPNIKWAYSSVSRNKTMTMENLLIILKTHKNFIMDWHGLSSNSGITMEDIEKYPSLPWKLDSICNNPNITLEFVKAHISKITNWHGICSSKMFTEDVYEKNPYLKLDIYGLVQNPNLTISFVKKIIKSDQYDEAQKYLLSTFIRSEFNGELKKQMDIWKRHKLILNRHKKRFDYGCKYSVKKYDKIFG